MRLVQIAVPDEQLDAVVDVLREQRLGYTVTAGAGEHDDQVVVNFAVPADAVEHVLSELEDTGFDKGTYTVSLDAEFANFEHVDAVQNEWGASPNRLAPDALRSKAKDLRRNTRSFLWMMILSAVVATAGLLMDSPAVVVGSMVIAPIVSPALTACVGTVRNDQGMILNSIRMQGMGLGVAIVTAGVFGWVVQQLYVVPPALTIDQLELVTVRISPSILAIVVGLAAGAAGAYGLATKGDVTIVGVMIAAALIPTAAAAGLGLAWGNFVVALGATVLLVLSMIGVNIGGATMLFYLDYRPDDVDDALFTYKTPYQGFIIFITLLLVVATVGFTGFAFTTQSTFEQSVNEALTDALDQEEYEGLNLMSTSIEYRADSVSDETVVTVTLARSSGEEFPELPNQLAQEISERTDEEAAVQIRYVEFDQSDSDNAGAAMERPPVFVHDAVPTSSRGATPL